jgi:hypothetical protein
MVSPKAPKRLNEPIASEDSIDRFARRGLFGLSVLWVKSLLAPAARQNRVCQTGNFLF